MIILLKTFNFFTSLFEKQSHSNTDIHKSKNLKRNTYCQFCIFPVDNIKRHNLSNIQPARLNQIPYYNEPKIFSNFRFTDVIQNYSEKRFI